MKTLIALAFAGALFQASCPPSIAQGMMMMPSCAAGDPVVGVNTKTKMYMSKSQMKMHMMGMSADQKMMMMKKHHIKMMCKSKADAMGGMMMKPM